MFTDFYNIWHTVFSVNFLTLQLLIYPPQLCTAATLPRKTLLYSARQCASTLCT